MAHFNIVLSFHSVLEKLVLLVTKSVSVYCYCSSGNMVLYMYTCVHVGVEQRVSAHVSRTEFMHA